MPVCPLVTEWDERSPLVTTPTDTCPRAGDVPHTKDLLCPFGFWGFTQMIEAPASSKDPTASIPVAPKAVVAVGESRKVDQKALAAHVQRLRSLFESRFAGVVVQESSAKKDILGLLSADLPVVYFYCHGDKDQVGSPDTFLSVGDREQAARFDFLASGNLFGLVYTAHCWAHLRLTEPVAAAPAPSP